MKQLQESKMSVLATLRALVPPRPLGYGESERIAELQANRLRELLGLTEPRLPEEAISELPRVIVRREFGLPVSGVTVWEHGRWVISLNASEPLGRVRFSLAHEFCHVLHHPSRRWFYEGANGPERAERLADYFAGCLLMPKRHVKRLVGEGCNSKQLAHAFGASAGAMNVRLIQLGLSEQATRCTWSDTRARSYFRSASTPAEVAA